MGPIGLTYKQARDLGQKRAVVEAYNRALRHAAHVVMRLYPDNALKVYDAVMALETKE